MTPLRSFVHEHLGDVEVLSHPVRRGMTRVIHVRDAGGAEWFAKRLLVPERYAAARRAYRLWSGVRGVATLRASDADRRCLLLPRLPGRQPAGNDVRALVGAGRLLRRLHARPPGPDWVSTWRTTSAAQVERVLPDVVGRGVQVDAGVVREAQAVLEALALPEVPTHGDYQPHNWLRSGVRVSVLDMESAEMRPAAFDVARLRYAAGWHDRRLLWTFLGGYGRTLTEDERRFVVAVMPWRALNAIDIGLRTARPQMVRHGTDVLDAVGRGQVRAL